MKKIISIFAIVFALTLVMSVSVFAEGFTAGTATGVTVTGAEDSLTLSLPTVDGAEYTVLLVAGSGLPTVGDGVETFAETGISYINQYTGDGTTMEIEVLPLMGAVADTENTDYNGTNTLYIGSNAEGFELISVPVTYEEAVEYVLGDVNADGVIDSSDSLAVLLYFANGTAFETAQGEAVPVEAGNVNGDSTVDSSDSLAILLYFANGTEF